MSNYTESLRLSRFPLSEVQEILLRFLKHSNPEVLESDPAVTSYTNDLIFFTQAKESVKQSISVDLVFKNLNKSPNTIVREIQDELNDALVEEVEDLIYFDQDWIKVDFFILVIRVNAFTKLLSRGMKEFLQNEIVYGETNGRLFIMSEMRDHPLTIYEVYEEILKPNGFEYRRDFVWGYSCLYAKDDHWKPVDWAVTPWLESVITPMGCYMRFKKTQLLFP